MTFDLMETKVATKNSSEHFPLVFGSTSYRKHVCILGSSSLSITLYTTFVGFSCYLIPALDNDYLRVRLIIF